MPHRHVDISKNVTPASAQTRMPNIACEGPFFGSRKWPKKYFGAVTDYMPYGLISGVDCFLLGVYRICDEHETTVRL